MKTLQLRKRDIIDKAPIVRAVRKARADAVAIWNAKMERNTWRVFRQWLYLVLGLTVATVATCLYMSGPASAAQSAACYMAKADLIEAEANWQNAMRAKLRAPKAYRDLPSLLERIAHDAQRRAFDKWMEACQ